MTQPLDRNTLLPEIGAVDREAGEFWVENPFQMPAEGYNLSAYERNRLFVNRGGRDFLDATFASAADLDSDSRAVAVADFDRDGAPDLLVGSVGGGPLRLFLNQAAPAAKRVRIELTGKTGNKYGIGARLTATAGGRTQRRDVFPANGGMGQGPVATLLGLGQAEKIETLEVLWPGGFRQTFKDIPAGHRIRLIEGQEKPIVLPMKP